MVSMDGVELVLSEDEDDTEEEVGEELEEEGVEKEEE